MRLDRAELWDVRLPLCTPVEWTVGGVEVEVAYLVLLLHDTGGCCGVSEIACRPEWNGMTPGLLAHAFQDVAWPRIAGIATTDSVAERLSRVNGLLPLRALCDNAWRDLTRPAAGGLPVSVSHVLTRAAPEQMVDEALSVRDQTGIDAFKVKLGQGIDLDARVLTRLRQALGPDAYLSGDANNAYRPDDLPELAAIGIETGLRFLEDPFLLSPDAATAEVCAKAGLPILADAPVEHSDQVTAFCDIGINQVATKPNRIGATSASAMVDAIGVRGGRVCNGTYSESALGAAAQVSFAQTLPPETAHPHEITFHRQLAQNIAQSPELRNGLVQPIAGHIADRLDLAALCRFGTKLACCRQI